MLGEPLAPSQVGPGDTAPSRAFVLQRPRSCRSHLLRALILPGAELREQSPATQAPKHNTRNYGLIILREEEEGWLTSEFLAAAEGRREHGVRASLHLLRGSFPSWRENLLSEASRKAPATQLWHRRRDLGNVA